MLFNYIDSSAGEVERIRRTPSFAGIAFRFKGVSTPPPPKPTPPPPTTNNAEVRMAQDEALKQARLRKGRQSTILAGAVEQQQQGMGVSTSGSGAGNTVLG